MRPTLTGCANNEFDLAWADWSAIEGRVNPWLSGRGDNTKLQQFRDGLDVYKVNAAETFRTTYDKVTKDQRQVGKVQELAGKVLMNEQNLHARPPNAAAISARV